MFQSAESSLHVLFIRASKQHRQPAMSMTLLIYQATVGTAMRIEFKLAFRSASTFAFDESSSCCFCFC